MSAHTPVEDSQDLSSTAEDENRHNRETDDMCAILNGFMASKEETLEELVGGFSYLTMDDLLCSKGPASTTPPSVFASSTDTTRTEHSDTQSASMTARITSPGHHATKIESASDEKKHGVDQSEDIEEEILEDRGNNSTSEDALFRHRPASLTKFDNFVLSEDPGNEEEQGTEHDDEKEHLEDDDDDDFMPTSRYTASFSSQSAHSKTISDEVAPTEPVKSEDAERMHFSSLQVPSDAVVSSDNVLSEAERVTKTSSVNTEATESDSSSQLCNRDIMIKTDKTRRHVLENAEFLNGIIASSFSKPADPDLTSPKNEQIETVLKPDALEQKHDSSAPSKICDNIDNVSEHKNQELEAITHNCDDIVESQNDKLTKSDLLKPVAQENESSMNVLASAEQICDVDVESSIEKLAQNSDDADLECGSSSEICDDVTAPTWGLNPGEADEEQVAVPVLQKVSVMEFSSKPAVSSGSGVLKADGMVLESEVVCSDEVVAFSLDEEFDYDNVPYTPKFTQAEIDHLNSFITQKS